MKIIEKIKKIASENIKTIILPESNDDRVLEAASIVQNEKIANIILIGAEEIKKNSKYDLKNVKIIDPSKSELLDDFTEKLYEMRKNKGLTKDEAKSLLISDYMYFACMLVKEKLADGIVSGACHSTANTLRPALQIIKTAPSSKIVSSFFLMDVPNCEHGDAGVFIFSDAGLVQNPSSEELAAIANDSAKSFKLLTSSKPKVAFLSHSTYGSAKHEDVTKVQDAVKIANEKYPEFTMDGEFQLDAAICPEICKAKAKNSKIQGDANVLIFPDLDAANIGYKLVQRLAKADAFGPICQGLASSVNDLSRGCSKDDIIGTIAITSIQASEF